MNELNNRRWRRHQLVTTAHDFILAVLPFRHPDSSRALVQFLDVAAHAGTSISETDAVLIDVLAVLNTHAHCLNLLDRYLAARRHGEPIARFRECMEQIFRSRGIGNRHVERAITLIDERYTDDTLSQADAAELVGLTASHLSARFKRHTGLTFTDYVRSTRLDAAATLLATTDQRIKEIWVSVGYNDASNFDHQFKERFGLAPRDYRRRNLSVRPVVAPTSAAIHESDPERIATPGTVLIVEDHDNARETVGPYLRSVGYDVLLSSTGDAGLEAACRVGPFAIVLDYHLPDMDGLTWLRAFRSRQPQSRAAVLLFTADWEVVERADEIAALGATFVSKLCDIDELVQLIATCAERDSAGSSAGLPKERN